MNQNVRDIVVGQYRWTMDPITVGTLLDALGQAEAKITRLESQLEGQMKEPEPFNPALAEMVAKKMEEMPAGEHYDQGAALLRAAAEEVRYLRGKMVEIANWHCEACVAHVVGVEALNKVTGK